jgi:diguanylate cyclase (GGDEF)-like protein/PAS domain S-box-containing protein
MNRPLEDPQTLRELVQNLREAVYVTSPDGEILDANPAFVALTGHASLDELRRTSVIDLFVEPAVRRRETGLLELEGTIREFEMRIKRRDGETRTVLDTAYVSSDASGRKVYNGILVDISERKRFEERLIEQSIRDPLTGCFNRRHLTQLAQRLDPTDHPWGALVVDVDHFKSYNDVYGHEAGDHVLVTVARFLLRQSRGHDGVVRLGGDEFLVVLDGADEQGTRIVAERVRRAAAVPSMVPFSLGWAVRKDREGLERTIWRADQSLLEVRGAERMPQRRLQDCLQLS